MSTSNAQAKLDYIAGTKTAIKNAIEAKGVTVGAEVTFREYADKIAEIETVEFIHVVRFIDYDGTVLKVEEVPDGQSATPPSTPAHNFLTFNSWTHAFNNVTEDLDVGALYDTTDGKSYLFITLNGITGLEPTLRMYKSTAAEMTIDWGDGNSETFSAMGNISKQHTYASVGDYVITVESAGPYSFGQGAINQTSFVLYESILTKVFVGANVFSLVAYAFYNNWSLEYVSLPASLASMENSMFANTYALKHVTFPQQLISIGSSVVSNALSLESAILPVNITAILGSAFYNCNSLKDIKIPASVTLIDANAFINCYCLTSVSIPDGVTIINTNAFNGCYSLREVVMPKNLETIASSAFKYCSRLQNITIPEGVLTIGDYAFNECFALESIIIPASVTSIGSYAFYNCYSLKSVELNGNPILGVDIFDTCSVLKTLIIPEGNTLIGNDFAMNCKALTSVFLPSTVTEIADDAFSACRNITVFQILASTPPALNSGAFDTYSKLLRIYVPPASVDAYKAAANWSTLANYIFPIPA